MEAPVTREEFDELRELVIAIVITLSKVVSEHPLCDAPAGNEDAIHSRLERLRNSPLALDSLDLRWALDVLAKLIPRNEF